MTPIIVQSRPLAAAADGWLDRELAHVSRACRYWWTAYPRTGLAMADSAAAWRALAAVADLVEVALQVADPRLDGEVLSDAHRETLTAGYKAGLMIPVQPVIF